MSELKQLFVARPSLPPFEEFMPMMREIWENKILTNNGPFHKRFSEALCRYLGVEHITLVTNATLGLMLSVKSLGLRGEVITTPYSFVATAHALSWGAVTPVFVDIDPETLNIDASLIEQAITPRTTAIMGVHCYGNPCDVSTIEGIAKRHGLKVIYDAAHAFGIRHESSSLMLQGDLSVLSFHATKVFNTFEGGAIVSRDAESKLRLDRLINYGFEDEMTVGSIGLNAKMSEFSAALGLLQLEHIDDYISRRKVVDERYRNALSTVRGIKPAYARGTQPENYYAFPILIGDDYGLTRDELHDRLKEAGIISRKYFAPVLSDFPMYRTLPSSKPELLPVAHRIASSVLCLPMYPDLTPEDQGRITSIIESY